MSTYVLCKFRNIKVNETSKSIECSKFRVFRKIKYLSLFYKYVRKSFQRKKLSKLPKVPKVSKSRILLSSEFHKLLKPKMFRNSDSRKTRSVLAPLELHKLRILRAKIHITLKPDMTCCIQKLLITQLKMSLPNRPDFFLDEGSWSKCGVPAPRSVSFIMLHLPEIPLF